MFCFDLMYEPLANSRVGLSSLGRIGETLIPIGDQRKRFRQLSVLNPERGDRLAQQLASRQRGRSWRLCEERSAYGREQQREQNRNLHNDASLKNFRITLLRFNEDIAVF